MKDHPMKIDEYKIAREYAFNLESGVHSSAIDAIAAALRSILPAPGEVLVCEDGEWVKRKGTLRPPDGHLRLPDGRDVRVSDVGIGVVRDIADRSHGFDLTNWMGLATRSAAEAAGKEDAKR